MSGSGQVQVLSRYLEYRRKGQIEQCLALMSPQIVLESQRDGRYQGLEQMRQYLQKVPYQGTWSQPYWSGHDQAYRSDGKVKLVGFIPVSVKILCRLDANNKIVHVTVSRA